jgi:hypothetical protein
MRAPAVSGLLALVSACAVGPGPGAALDPELVEIMQHPDDVGGVKVRTDRKGRVTKMSVYHAREQDIPLWVRGMATEKWPDAKVRSYETEWYADAGRVYEVEVTLTDGKTCEMSVNNAGVERYVECEIPPDSIPEAVAATMAQALPTGKIEEAEETKGPDMHEFTLEVEAEGREYYMRVRADGKLIQHLLRVPTILEVPAR